MNTPNPNAKPKKEKQGDPTKPKADPNKGDNPVETVSLSQAQEDAKLIEAQEKEEAKLKAQQDREAKAQQKKEEREEAMRLKAAEREEANKKKAEEREAAQKIKDEERLVKAKEKAEKQEAERAIQNAKKSEEREAAAAERAKQREADKVEKDKARELAKEEAKKLAEAAKEQKKAEREAATEQRKADRKAEAEARKAALEARRAETHNEGARRPKATHVKLTAGGLSNPQSLSIRGRLLAYMKEQFQVGEEVEIEALGKSAEHLLYGVKVRSLLNKLDEAGHVDFVTRTPPALVLEESPADEPVNEAAEQG
ncbi:hypothetical protein XccvBFoX7_gp55c [Xanthomonas phage FoX7]|uniref:Uncharacterized protein n=2 Tax=Carpasinavirus XcP1 TaxID=2182344 RepID=A0A858NR13_9CAUD|nr:hypothetical protein XccvBFoX6_gp55c [Xanthomonas phage FoX6]QJB22212.1 hypothetical protein XccvBFoX7_gp55c [Xanthomonas phage FoX7]